VISRSRSDGTATATAQLPIPDQIGRYQVIDRLATGGMAEVFICLERQLAGLERLIVVKRILPHLAIHDTFVEMFLAEARYVARINHPNVVQIHELGEDGGLPFLSMEYVAGCSLRDLLVAAIESGKLLPAGVAIGLALQACAGAHAAHELTDSHGKSLGLVHRDISPHNLMVTNEGHVKLLDFGIAKATEATGLDNTRTGALKGKVHYMAPEQCKQEPLDRRADVFALGIVAWELLASERLFKRDSELEAMQAIVNGDLRDLRTIRRDLPTVVVAAIEKALIPKKDARFQTAEAMKKALHDASKEFDTSPEAIAAFLRPLLGKKLEDRRQGFLDAARTRRPPMDLARSKTGSWSRSLSAAGMESGEGDSTVADKPSQRAQMATEEGGFDDIADIPTIRQRGFPVDGPPKPGETGQTSPSLPSLPAIVSPPPRKPWRLAAAVTVITCVVVTAGLLLLPKLRGPTLHGTPLIVAWPPTVAPEQLEPELQTLARLLEQHTKRPVHVRLMPSYDAVVDAIKSGEAAFGVMPPYLFVSARRAMPGIVPLATKLVDGSSGSDGVIVVRESSDIRAVPDLLGKTFCFPNDKSTSGYVLPRAALRAAGLNADVDVKAHFSGNHTQVLKDLNAGVCEAGATYSGGYLAADRAGIPVGQARVLMITGRSPQDMVVASPTTPAEDRATLGAALLALNPKVSLGTDTVGTLERISGFSVPRLADYDALEKLVDP
jgi:serine/threonine-protein kinase